ncbi:hypothetical protein bcgnr5412_54830 [Bacillus cereus]|uniref:hypothetical protein n=1 Tax=Bacillus cereus TaxID=1396 RepID=UPI00240E4CCA|nr:hypothetical protein [Bacillus cereus]MDG1596054.1 hypothetical protein [Bacillus cereus]
MKPVQMYLGSPQQAKLPVYEVQSNQQATVKQIVLSNTVTTDSKITVTVNTIDIMKDLIVTAGETRIIDTTIVLNQNDRLSLEQEKLNAINVMINGVIEPMMGY